MLPAMTAAVLLARRGHAGSAGLAVAVATLAKQTGALTLLPVAFLAALTRGHRGVGRAALGFSVPLALVALAMGPGQLFYWTVLGNGSYVSVETASAFVFTALVVMSLAWGLCNLPILWRLPAAWNDRRLPARDGRTDTDLWLWALSAALSVMVGLRFFGHYYLQLVPPLCLLTTGALTRGSRKIAVATLAVSLAASVGFSVAGYVLRPFDRAPRYETVSEFLAAHTESNDRILVWGSVPEIYWASGRRPATRFVGTTSLLTNNHPGRPPADAAPEDTNPVVWDWFFEDMAAHPPRYIVDTAPALIRGAQWTPIDRFPRLEAIVEQQYRYVRSIDHIDLYERRGT